MDKTRFLENLELKDWQRKFNPKPTDSNGFLFETRTEKAGFNDSAVKEKLKNEMSHSFSW